MHKTKYLFTCFFNRKIKCGEFKPSIMKKRNRMPESCKRCRYYLEREQKNLDIFKNVDEEV